MDTLFDITPTGRITRTVGPMPGDTVQDSLFGDAPVVIARKHTARPTVAVVDTTPVMFATDAGQFDGQTTTTDLFGAAL